MPGVGLLFNRRISLEVLYCLHNKGRWLHVRLLKRLVAKVDCFQSLWQSCSLSKFKKGGIDGTTDFVNHELLIKK